MSVSLKILLLILISLGDRTVLWKTTEATGFLLEISYKPKCKYKLQGLRLSQISSIRQDLKPRVKVAALKLKALGMFS